MTLVSIIILLCVAGVCGAIATRIVGYSHAGLLGMVAIGFIGGLLGMWVARSFGLPELATLRVGGESFPIIWTIVGSALFVALLGLVSGRRHRRAYG